MKKNKKPLNEYRYFLVKQWWDPIRMAPDGIYNVCEVNKVELTEEELIQLYNSKQTPYKYSLKEMLDYSDLKDKIRKVLDNEKE